MKFANDTTIENFYFNLTRRIRRTEKADWKHSDAIRSSWCSSNNTHLIIKGSEGSGVPKDSPKIRTWNVQEISLSEEFRLCLEYNTSQTLYLVVFPIILAVLYVTVTYTPYISK